MVSGGAAWDKEDEPKPLTCSYCGHPVIVEYEVDNKLYTKCTNCGNRIVFDK